MFIESLKTTFFVVFVGLGFLSLQSVLQTPNSFDVLRGLHEEDHVNSVHTTQQLYVTHMRSQCLYAMVHHGMILPWQ